MRFVFLAVLALSPLVSANPLSDADLSVYRWQRDREFSAQAGERFMQDLRTKSPEVAANVEDAVRYEIQSDEAQKFAHQKKFVLAAYGVLFAIFVLFAYVMARRQRALFTALGELEAKLRK